MFKRTVAVITLGTFLAGCAGQTLSSNQRGGLVFATVGLGLAAVTLESGEHDCADDPCSVADLPSRGHLALIGTGLFVALVGLLMLSDPDAPHDASPTTGLATNDRERRILRLAANGQCRAAVRMYRELRETDLAAAGRLKLDDKLDTCITLEDARARGTIRSLPHE